MVDHAAEYRWSSYYRANAQGETDTLIVSPLLYVALDSEIEPSRATYRELFRHELELGFVDDIHQATNGTVPLAMHVFWLRSPRHAWEGWATAADNPRFSDLPLTLQPAGLDLAIVWPYS